METTPWRPAGVPAVIPMTFPDLFTALDLQPLYARFVKAPVNPNAQVKTFVSDIKDEPTAGYPLGTDGRASPGGKTGPSTPIDTAGIKSPSGGILQLQQQKGQPSAGNLKKAPKPKLFSSVYEELLQEIPDPVPLPPNESLLDIPYHRYPNHLDDPNFQFTSLVTSDRFKMALRLQVGHAQGVSGKYIDGKKNGVKSANQRRKERIKNKKNKDAQQRATAPANLTSLSSGLMSAASSPEYRSAMTPSYQTSRRVMTPTYGHTASASTPGHGSKTPGYDSRTPGYSSKTPGHGSKTPGY
ncbi:hypothetical protein QFC21_002907 [Naganishia friedmannii]|uniref:Uncharacterized protein n=1 Tax=Naganishia friedmannii TaxID=89922 RepID=A0ACC2VUD2_9TREE|nr:hypothetical protein QFC21_002907 [Naganishia friedmannii]